MTKMKNGLKWFGIAALFYACYALMNIATGVWK